MIIIERNTELYLPYTAGIKNNSKLESNGIYIKVLIIKI